MWDFFLNNFDIKFRCNYLLLCSLGPFSNTFHKSDFSCSFPFDIRVYDI